MRIQLPQDRSEDIPPDVFDRALALAKQLAEQEINNSRTSYDRFISMVRLYGGIVTALVVGLAGFVTWSNIHADRFLKAFTDSAIRDAKEHAAREVATQLPGYVHDETVKQFQQQNVGAVVQTQVALLAGTAIDARVRERVEPIAREEVDKRRNEIIVAAQRPGSITQSALVRPGAINDRAFTTTLHAGFIDSPAVPLKIISDEVPDHISFAAWIRDQFAAAGWKVDPSVGRLNLSSFPSDVTLLQPQTFGNSTAAVLYGRMQTIKNAFNELSISVQVVPPGPGAMQGSDQTLYLAIRTGRR